MSIKSRLHPQFRRDFESLPRRIQRQATLAYRRFCANPNYPGLEFKRLNHPANLWSARVSDSYRAVAARDGEELVWIFIGSHAAYDKLLAK